MDQQSAHNIAEIIGKVRDAHDVDAREIAFLVEGISSGKMNDAQVGAFAMAVLCKGLSTQNGMDLTKSMRDSGRILTWDVDGHIVDKHSTGGVGDCVSLLLAPILAACELYVPMISGRGLGHTGGTLDKLEAIDGFSTKISIDLMQKQLKNIGCVMAGQSADLAPADGRLYAIRDVTGTVPSVDLITASILSKKLAAGLEHLVLDVKMGSGAFMKTKADAVKLATRLVQVAGELGCQTSAMITAMDVPLSSRAGNALEVMEVLEVFEGERLDEPLYMITKALCAKLLVSTKTCADIQIANARIDKVMATGHAFELFLKMCAAQGGAGSLNAIQNALAEPSTIREIYARDDIAFHGFDAYEMGMIVVGLGGGRTHPKDVIDPSVGLSNIARPSVLKKGDLLASIHAKNEHDANLAEDRLRKAIRAKPCQEKLIIEEIG